MLLATPMIRLLCEISDLDFLTRIQGVTIVDRATLLMVHLDRFRLILRLMAVT